MLRDYRFFHPIRVRYSEIDGQKIVFNSHYSTYLDIATTEYFREIIGDQMGELAEKRAFDPVLKKITIEFVQPAKLDDIVQVYCRVKKVGNSSFQLEHTITRGGEILVEAEVVQVNYDPRTGNSQPIPQEIKQKLAIFEDLTI
ncbi:thioesterase family protein [Pseudalkalibacillus hwajinpoensis]|uniref:acyl-CoA thioesterase n=1 Tax=Guptibacillus hwajinpoensis TaxID=208199 RepID=UPI00325A846D